MKTRTARVLASLSVLAVVATLAAQAAAQLENNARAARPEVTLPMGPARNVILKSCTSCHGIDEYGYYALDRDGWEEIIERMKTTRSGLVQGALISDPDKEILLDWLVTRFGPDTAPFPREYVPRILSEADFLVDETAEARLAGTCEGCHTLDQVLSNRANEEQWRATLLDMVGRGAALPLSDVEPLVEWLSRTRGLNPSN